MLDRRNIGRALAAPEFWMLFTLTAVAALIRFSTLGHQSFWADEATTVHEMGLSFGGLLHAVRVHETTPPLYFVLTWVWCKVFGVGAVGIRSLSALAGTALIPVAYYAARELTNRWAAAVVAVLVAISPWMLWYSQEARSYMLLALLLTLSLWFWARAERTTTTRDLGLWALFSALAVLTHFFAGFVVAPEGLWLLWRLRSRRAFVACAVVGAVQLAMLPLASSDTGNLLNWLAGQPLGTRVQEIPVQFTVSQLYLAPGATSGTALWLTLLVVVLVAGLLVVGARQGSRDYTGAARAAALAACVILIPVVMAYVGSDYVVPRNLIGGWIPLAIVFGAATMQPRLRPVGLVLVAVAVIGFAWADVKIQSDWRYQRPDWRAVAAALGPAGHHRAIFAYDGNLAEEPLAVYLPGTLFSYSGNPAPQAAATIDEVDIVAPLAGALNPTLPAGFRLTSNRIINDEQVLRLALSPARTLTTSQVEAIAPTLMASTGVTPSLLIQR